MKQMNSKGALELLEKCNGMSQDDDWIKHSICVGNTASIIAKQLNHDEDYAKTLGYIHDIGKRFVFGTSHGISGYEYLLELGYDEKYANVCLTHSYLNNDINCVAGGVPNVNSKKYDFEKEFIKNHEYTIYEKIINLCDLLCKQNIMTLEKRLIDLISRYGAYENTQYHIKAAQKLKKEIDELLGCSVYSLFDDIEI